MADRKLDEYRKKRDFERTAEPAGGAIGSTESGRHFVVQKHAARNLHYDFRLEFGGVLKSWAVPKGPSLDPSQKPLAVQTEDHPLEYASFEGIIPKGEYGGGTVMLWDRGEWEPLADPVVGLQKGDLKFRLHGSKLRGDWVLARMSGRASESGKNWLLIKKRDAEARTAVSILAAEPRSVISGRTLDEIAADPEEVWKDGKAQPVGGVRRTSAAASSGPVLDPESLPGAIRGKQPDTMKPQLANAGTDLPDGDDWLHEIKLDGYRLLTMIDHGQVRLLTRNENDWTGRFPTVVRSLERLTLETGVLDGEIVVLDSKGIADFGALQNAFKGFTESLFTYYIFDIPYAQGYDLRKTPLIERKMFLKRVIQAAPMAAPTIQYCDHIVGKGPVVFSEAERSGLEGIISKRLAGRYESRRSWSWLKFKCLKREEFVIAGYSDPSGSRVGFGALVLGQHDGGGRLVYCGRVGTGFTDELLEHLATQLHDLRIDEPALADPHREPDMKTIHWVSPELVCEVEYGSWTREDIIRHPSFKGMREDLEPHQVRKAGAQLAGVTHVKRSSVIQARRSPADAEIAGVRISNPDRIVYPEDGVSKGDVAEYFNTVADWILPYLVDRPLSLVRCPVGLPGEAFYQRHVGDGFPKPIRKVEIEEEEGPGILIRDRAGLLSLVQMGVLEIHPWGARADRLDRPDQLVFDLDPGSALSWTDIAGAALFVGDYLDHLGLESFVKTSGGKGIHIVVPIVRRTDWKQAKVFSKAVADGIVARAPRNFVAIMTKALRTHRVFIDYLRNQRGSTSVGAYSTRARNGANVSTPLSWDELAGDPRAPSEFTVATVPQRLNTLDADPWERFGEITQSLSASVLRRVGL